MDNVPSGVNFSADRLVQAKIMELVDPNNPKNFRFSTEFESSMEGQLSDDADIKNVFRKLALAYATKLGVNLMDIDIKYATDLYLGINPWTKTSKSIP